MTYVDRLIARFAPTGVLVDTNLLVLLVIGAYDEKLIGSDGFKRIRSYTPDDLRLLKLFVEQFCKMVTTPHVLAEASNLIGQLFGESKSSCYEKLKLFIDQTVELCISSSAGASRTEFPYLGLTDSALATVAEEYLILTDDARCVNLLGKSGIEALNFTNLRTYIFLKPSP